MSAPEPNGYCECGCGEKTSLVRWSDATKGERKGEHRRFVQGHTNRANVSTLYEIDPETGCWVWTGTLARGYGVVTLKGKRHLVHRLFFERRHGWVPDTLDHLCRNRGCVNPDHVEPCSRGENVRRGSVAKLDWKTVAQMRTIAATLDGSERARARTIGAVFNVPESTARSILRGKRWPESDMPALIEAGRQGT